MTKLVNGHRYAAAIDAPWLLSGTVKTKLQAADFADVEVMKDKPAGAPGLTEAGMYATGRYVGTTRDVELPEQVAEVQDLTPTTSEDKGGGLATGFQVKPGRKYSGRCTVTGTGWAGCRVAIQRWFDGVKETSPYDPNKGMTFRGTYVGNERSTWDLAPEGIVELHELGQGDDSNRGKVGLGLAVLFALIALGVKSR